MGFDTIIPYAAAADLSALQFHAVKDNGSGAAAAISADTDKPIGILQNKPAVVGDSAVIDFDGVCRAKAGGTIEKGDSVGPDATGKLVKRTYTSGVGKYIIGRAGSDAADGDIFPVALLPVPVLVSPGGIFVSAETTGTGSAQNVAHGLGVVPVAVLVAPTEHPGTPDTGAFDIAEGTHTTTNVVVTVTANVKFKVLAFS